MSRKANLSNSLKKINNEWRNTDTKIKAIYEDNRYTPQAQEEAAQELRVNLDAYLTRERETIISIVDDKLESIFRPGSNVFNAAYQSRLTNVLSIVTLTGNEIDLRDLKSMIEPFEGDYTALQAIRTAITNAGIDKREDYPTVLASLATGTLEKRKETHRKLVKFKKSINGFDVIRGMGSMSWVKNSEYLGYETFLDDFDDNLDYIGEVIIQPTDINLDIR